MTHSKQRGLSLIELLLALSLATLVLSLLGSVFIASLSAQRRGADLRDAQDHAAALVDLIARDVRSTLQATSVRIRPPFVLEEGEAFLSVLTPGSPLGADPAWILYVFLPSRNELLQQVVVPNPGGRVTVEQSRVVGIGVVRVAIEQAANGATIEVEVQRGREIGVARATAAPRNP